MPSEIQTLITQFTYNVKSIEQLNQVARYAWLNTRQISVPPTWKNLLLTRNGNTHFDWSTFLKTNLNPWGISTLISHKGVRGTVQLLNWHFLKQQCTASSAWSRANYKHHILEELRFWTDKSADHVFYLQRLLCSVNIPECLNKYARGYCQQHFKSIIITNTVPLSYFVNPPRMGL